LVCDPEPGTILASQPNILEQLKLCPALTGAQRDALNALLLSGDTEHGDPSGWDSQTLQDLGPLVLALNQTTLSLVGEAAREDFRRSIAAAYITQDHSQREKSLMLLRALAAASAAPRPRLKRSAARCESEPITASNIADTVPYLSLEELDLCLSSDVLIKNLEAVLEQPLISEALQVLKKKVDEYFPSGIPEEQLGRLGVLSRLYTAQEISRWQVTSSDTLWALLSPSGGMWNDSQVQQLLSRFLALGGSLTGPLLQEIGGKHLCELQEEQIQQIPAGAIGNAGQLNISSCSQSKKEQLYGKAREAFASLASSPGPYYCRIQPYLGGAPAEDLKDLASSGVINMDLDTFLSLNPQEFQKLSVTDVKNLLGENLPELKGAEQEPLVVSWVQRQRQRELDCVLGIGLQGGLPEPAGTASPAGPTSMVTATTPVPTTPATVTSMVTATTPDTVTSMLPPPRPLQSPAPPGPARAPPRPCRASPAPAPAPPRALPALPPPPARALPASQSHQQHHPTASST
ncbi:MSLNL protein, partial [Hippolais icterina]|nr:MSLNL protein [Hippolais icterina]